MGSVDGGCHDLVAPELEVDAILTKVVGDDETFTVSSNFSHFKVLLLGQVGGPVRSQTYEHGDRWEGIGDADRLARRLLHEVAVTGCPARRHSHHRHHYENQSLAHDHSDVAARAGVPRWVRSALTADIESMRVQVDGLDHRMERFEAKLDGFYDALLTQGRTCVISTLGSVMSAAGVVVAIARLS